ncbi:outer membrane protein assembly factor BamA [soil metagenome]
MRRFIPSSLTSTLTHKQFRRATCAVAVSLAFSQAAWAVDPFVIRDIRVDGLQRTEPGTVFNYLPFKIGDTYNDDKGIAAIRALFATGFYRDVRLEQDRDVLIVYIEERPAISSLTFTGNKEFDTDKMKAALRDIGIAEARTFDRSLLERAEQELKRLYLSRGKYGVDIKTTVTPEERNRVAVNFSFDEGDIATIKEINIVGNSVFSDKELIKQLDLTTSGWFTWFTKTDQYSKQKLTADLEKLRSYYLDRGYLEFNVDSTQVAITPDRKDIYVTVTLTEGQKYTISDIKLGGELLDKADELKPMIRAKPGDTFSAAVMNATTKQMTERLGNYGYAFATATPAPQIDREKATAAFTIIVDPGRRAYVRSINITGNGRSRDEVIRRELRQLEGSYFNGERVRASRDRVDRLGFFDEVKVETPQVPGAADLVDVNYAVKERSTGSLNVGAGYSSYDKIILSASITQNNLFGTGNSLSFEVNTSRVTQTFAISQNNPYFTVDGVSQGFDLYTRRVRPYYNLEVSGDFGIRSSGGALRFGVPLTDFTTLVLGTGFESTQLDVNSGSPLRYQTYANQFGTSSNAATVNAALIRDTRDNGVAPSRGMLQRATFEVTAPILDLRYYRAGLQQQYFMPLPGDFVLALNGQFDYGHGFGGKPYPLFKNYQAGGIGSVRGYENGTLGEIDNDGSIIGGASRIIGNAELQIPLPGTTDRSIRMFVFTDAGTTFREGQNFTASELRYSAGFGISWLSPVGPLKISYGVPFHSKPGDQTERFQFQIGTGF